MIFKKINRIKSNYKLFIYLLFIFTITTQLSYSYNSLNIEASFNKNNLKNLDYNEQTVINYSNGSLYYFEINSDQYILGIEFYKNTGIYLYDNGKIHKCVLSKPTDIFGVSCEYEIEFYANGNIKCLYLANSTTINDIPCSAGKDAKICFYDNGQIAMCTLSRQMYIEDILCREGRLEFYDNGKLAKCMLAKRRNIGSILCKEYISFYKSGAPKKLTIAGITRVQRLFCEDTISFYESGQIEECNLAVPMTVQDIDCDKGYINFYNTGKLRFCVLSKDFIIKNKEYKKGTRLYFNEDGNIAN